MITSDHIDFVMEIDTTPCVATQQCAPLLPFRNKGHWQAVEAGVVVSNPSTFPVARRLPRQYYFNKIITSRILKDSLQTNFFTHSYIVETKKTVDRSF